MEQSFAQQPARFGLAGFVVGVVSLVVILIEMSAYFEPPAQGTAAYIGEFAAELKNAAKRTLAGEAAPASAPVDQITARFITIAALCGAGLALVLGAMGLYRHEPPRLPYLAVGIGLSAFVMQFVFWLAMIICGVVLLTSLLSNLDDIFA